MQRNLLLWLILCGTMLALGAFAQPQPEYRLVPASDSPAAPIGAFYLGFEEVSAQQYCTFLNAMLAQRQIEVRGGGVFLSGGKELLYATRAMSATAVIGWDGTTFTVAEDRPLDDLRWPGAACYCNWLSAQQHKPRCYDTATWACRFDVSGYRLPTEDEWAHAVRCCKAAAGGPPASQLTTRPLLSFRRPQSTAYLADRGSLRVLLPADAEPHRSVATFVLTSPAVKNGGMLPVEFTGDGASASLPLAWSGAPAGTKSYALIMHHLAPDQVKWYWTLYNIPATVQSLPKNVKDIGVWGTNSVNHRLEYAPPHSKGPGVKEYILTLYALSAPLQITVPPDQVNRDVLLEAMQGHILGAAELHVMYSRGEAPQQ